MITPGHEAGHALLRPLPGGDLRADRQSGARYSRDRNHYGGCTALLGEGDRYYSYHYVTGAMGVLDHSGLVGHDLGQWGGSGTKGGQSGGPAHPTPSSSFWCR